MLKDQLPNNNNLLGFVPAIVVDNLMEKIRHKEVRKIPERQTFNSVVMFADISGFTNLSEKLAVKGYEGAELLAFALTRYMEFLVKSIGKSGGDIFKFAGDAMIIIWPPPKENSDEELTTLCRRAIQSSLDIQSKLHEIKLVEDIKLSVKIGFGVGQVTILHVGGVFSRAEYLAAGDPLKEAFECEHLAPGGGYIIISESVYKRVMNYFEFELIDHKGHGNETDNFYYIKKAKKNQMVPMKADALLLNTRIKPSDIEAIRSSLVSYIPAAVLPFIEIDEEKWSHELRRLSIMFCNLGIDLSDAQSNKGLDRIQQVIETVQKCVYKHQGSLNKLLMDDKGSTLMIIFGLYPMAHQDDPVRSVLSGIQLIKDLKKINCACSVGIATGVVFAGVVGTSGSRREFSVLGDKVNLSARFMQAACKEKERKILVDETTKSLAENKIAFKFVMKQPVKGKTGEIPFYQPIDPEEDPGVNNFPYNIRTHMFTPQKSEGIIPPECYEMVGKHREESLKLALNAIEKFLKRPDHNVLILLTGSYGSGKSLFIRNLLDRTYKISETINWKYQENCGILVNTLNSSTKALSFNGWRSISQQILYNLAMRNKNLTENCMIKILENDVELLNNLFLAADILNLKIPQAKKEASSQENLRFQEKELKTIKKILLKLFANFLDEQNNMEESEISHNSRPRTITQTTNSANTTPPLILILEDMQDYDAVSWSFTKKLLKNLKKVVIVASIRDKYCEIPPSFAKRTLDSNPKSRTSGSNNDNSSAKKSHFDIENLPIEERLENWATELEESCDPSGFVKIELMGLAEEEIRLFVRKMLHTSEGMMENQPMRMNSTNEMNGINVNNNVYIDTRSSNSKRKETNCIENPQKLVDKFLMALNSRTEGKPLDLSQLISNLQKSGFIKIEGPKLVITYKMRKLYEMKQFLTIEPPLSRISINGEILDRLETHAYLLLKAAAIIGEEFDLQMLMKVNPFQMSISHEKLRIVLNYLEKVELIEILNETEHNVIYRFLNPFMREIIYNRMLFSQRRQLHRFVAEAMQANPFQNLADEKQECDKLIYNWCLAENIDAISDETENSQFSNKAKRSLIVKKISSLLSKNQHSLSIILKSGYLEKKSDHGRSWSSRFLVLNGKDLKYYYSEADFKKNTDFALGVISLKHIFKIFYLDEKETKKKFAFVIYTGSWQKKNKEMGVREFYFSATDYSILETWTTYLEFLRAKAIYDDFVSSFGKISFPLNNNDANLLENGGFNNNKMNMSRMTQALENNRASYKSPTMQRKNTLSTSRKMTIMKGLNNKQIQLNTLQEVMASNANQENAKRVKERCFRFIMTGMKVFFSHLTEVSNPKTNSLILGQTTQLLRKIPLNIEETLLEDAKLPNKGNLTDSQDLNKGNLDFVGDSSGSGGENMKIDSSQNSSIRNEKKKSGEDSILRNNSLNPANFLGVIGNNTNNAIVDNNGVIPNRSNRNSIDILKIKSNLEMIKEVEENHSIITGSRALSNNNNINTGNSNNSDTNPSKNNNIITRPSHFYQNLPDDRKKVSETPLILNPHRSTLDDLDCDILSNDPFKNYSAKPSTLLTRQELDCIQFNNAQQYKGSTEEILEQIDPLHIDRIQVKLEEYAKLQEINEGKSCDDIVNEIVVLSKKPHKSPNHPGYNNMDFQDIVGDLNNDNYKENHRKKSLSVISRKDPKNGIFIESPIKRINSRKGSVHEKINEFDKNINSFENLQENVQEELENKTIPKVLIRKERNMKEMKKNDEDFMEKLAFRVFQQEKPKKKEEERTNPNYSRMNFYKKG